MSNTLRIEMEPLGVRVVTVMVGSASTPIFDKPDGQLHLPETSYYRYPGVEEMAKKQRAEHKDAGMSVDKLAPEIVKGILTGTKDPLWAGTFATTVRWAIWAYPRWFLDWSCNVGRGLEKVKAGISGI